jgi:zinc transporter ZupT
MVAQGNVGVAFALVLGGGLATCIGACIVFCIKLATPKLLASSLGFAAGVMM